MNSQTLEKKSIQEKYNLDKNYELIYVSNDDYFEDAKDIERIIQDGTSDFLFEDADWCRDSQYESVRYLIDELEKEHGEISDDEKEEIKEYLEEHDVSDPAKQVMKNTPKRYFYYSLGIEVENHDAHVCCEEGCAEKVVNEIMKALRTRNPETKRSVREVVYNAGYGGNVVLLFEDDMEYLLNNGKIIEFGPKTEICIMDRMMGSGHSAPLNTKIAVEFNRQNLHCDEGAPGYSFTGDVCGMTRGFMDGCQIRDKKSSDKVIKTQISEEEQSRMEREKEYERKWREEKKCTAGDMKISRHKDTPYRNEYPCGSKCTECGTFWVD